jgi:hypothetical protein
MAGWARHEAPIGSKSEMRVHVWRAADARTTLDAASRFVGTDVADRRNLIMVNGAWLSGLTVDLTPTCSFCGALHGTWPIGSD